MDLSKIVNTGTRALGRTNLGVQKVSPELLVGAGIVGLVAAGVMAARASMKAQPILERASRGLETVEFHAENDSEYASKDKKKDLIYIYRTTSIDLVKLYAPSITLGTLGIACVLGGHHILKQRNVALAAAYKAVEVSYNEYRKRVRTAVGEERELEIYQDVQEVSTTDTKGKVTKNKILGPNAGNGYGRFFDQLNPNYQENASLNLAFITSVQRFWNMKLNLRGYVFLNEVYETLGIPATPAGQVVGWCSDGNGGEDGYIDFNIDNPKNKQAQMFIRGDERSVFLDFNVDGEIFRKAF